MATMKNVADKICEMIYSKERRRPEPYDTTAEVRRVENGKAYVHLPGGIDETPVALTIDAAAGDMVQVRVADGAAWLVGNRTAPPTDDTTARKAQKTADKAETDAKKAEVKAEEAQETARNTAQYFWYLNGQSSEAGAHVTEIPQEEFMQNPSGGNILMRSNSIKLRMALITLAELTGTTFIFCDPSTGQERLKLFADGLDLTGQKYGGTATNKNYSFARLRSQYLSIGFHSAGNNEDIISEYFGYSGVGNYMYSRRNGSGSGPTPDFFVSTKHDDQGFKIIHDRGTKPESGQTNYVETTALTDGDLLLQEVDSSGNVYQQIDINPSDGGGIVIVAQDEDGNQNEIFKLEGTYDTADASNSFANMDVSGDITAGNIGARLEHSPAATSCTTRRWFQVAYLELPPGIWMVDCNALFPATNATGTRQIFITDATSGYNNVTIAPASIGNITRDILVGANTAQYPQCHFSLEVTTKTTYRLEAYQGSDSTMNVTGRMLAVRIK